MPVDQETGDNIPDPGEVWMDTVVEDGEVVGFCRNCGYEEARQPEEMEPWAECPSCRHNAFGGPTAHIEAELPPEVDPK